MMMPESMCKDWKKPFRLSAAEFAIVNWDLVSLGKYGYPESTA